MRGEKRFTEDQVTEKDRYSWVVCISLEYGLFIYEL